MKNTPLLLSLLCCVPLLQSCESVPPKQAWGFQPLLKVRHGNESPAAYYQLGRYYQGQNRSDLAIPAFQQALALDKHYAEAHNALGSLYAGQRQFELAIMEFQLALAAAPDTAHFYNNLGYAYYLQGRPVEAAAALEKAAALKPGDAKITTNLNLALAQKTRAELVQQAFTPASPPASSASHVTAPAVAPSVTEPTVAAPVLAPASPPVAVEPTAPAPSPSQPVIQPLVAEPAPVIAPPQSPQLAPAEPQQTVEPAAPTMLAAVPPRTAPPSARAALYEVSNGNGITGMARRVNQALLAQGYPAARLTNNKPFRQPVTVVEYRPGYAAVAAQLSASLPLKPAITEKAGLRQSTDVRLVLGRDVMTRLALVTPRPHETQLALGAPPRLPKP
ncbi:LytR C-terminal domain-containing protein [Vogesella indigofera]|uniref:LytR C-terminal domain-containing protein n=1 Tax=Vogesella indigofera TaxID=45465 RepID=UPI00234D6ED2|nr:tetratricopeptide repeat protein [Vogesella indigofera]MDC7704005.1 tetratricopeptide repeat protein [Vogesella indigofera]